uniref:Uncharacterized protein n=1 Tax=Rhizophagus irregularis (strain DAOM 181602 / DAOM 197198 / MUCL 43194) TaxID=747089 RepID=U9UR96_RHIID
MGNRCNYQNFIINIIRGYHLKFVNGNSSIRDAADVTDKSITNIFFTLFHKLKPNCLPRQPAI